MAFENINKLRSPTRTCLNINNLKPSEITNYRATFARIIKEKNMESPILKTEMHSPKQELSPLLRKTIDFNVNLSRESKFSISPKERSLE